MNGPAVFGSFIDSSAQPVFVLVRRTRDPVRGCVLIVPPFAEEMNKCRRMITSLAIEVASRRYSVVMPDLSGTGDSGGEFVDARWDAWRCDLRRTAEWSAAQGMPVTCLVAVRIGASLACDAIEAGDLPKLRSSVLWQPVFDGSRHLSQFLRLRVAASLSVEDRRESVAELRERLAKGSTVAVGGYDLSGPLASDIDALRVPETLPENLGAVHWLQVGRSRDSGLPPESLDLIQRSRRAGITLRESLHLGEPFWSATEVVTVPSVIVESVNALTDWDDDVPAADTARGRHG